MPSLPNTLRPNRGPNTKVDFNNYLRVGGDQSLSTFLPNQRHIAPTSIQDSNESKEAHHLHSEQTQPSLEQAFMGYVASNINAPASPSSLQRLVAQAQQRILENELVRCQQALSQGVVRPEDILLAAAVQRQADMNFNPYLALPLPTPLSSVAAAPAGSTSVYPGIVDVLRSLQRRGS